jgi:hypothetical protein
MAHQTRQFAIRTILIVRRRLGAYRLVGRASRPVRMGLRPTNRDENPCKCFGGRALAGAGLKPRLQQHRQRGWVFDCAAGVHVRQFLCAMRAREAWRGHPACRAATLGSAGERSSPLEIGQFQEGGPVSRDGIRKLRPQAWRASRRPTGVSRPSRPEGSRQMRSRRNSTWARPLRTQKSVGEAD